MLKTTIAVLSCSLLVIIMTVEYDAIKKGIRKLKSHKEPEDLIHLGKYYMDSILYFSDDSEKPLAANLLFEETFEGNKPLSTAVNIQTGTVYGFGIVDEPVFNGNRAGRFELRDTDPIIHRGKRAELFVIDRITHNERWYSFAAYFPEEGYEVDSQNELISQWHQGGSPAISLRIANDHFYLRVPHKDEPEKWMEIDIAPVGKDVWHEFVFHIIHSRETDALIEVWHNGKKKIIYTGPNHHDMDKMPYWKVGIYKARWNKHKSDTSLRVIYFDDIRVGNEYATYADMSPANNIKRIGNNK